MSRKNRRTKQRKLEKNISNLTVGKLISMIVPILPKDYDFAWFDVCANGYDGTNIHYYKDGVYKNANKICIYKKGENAAVDELAKRLIKRYDIQIVSGFVFFKHKPMTEDYRSLTKKEVWCLEKGSELIAYEGVNKWED